jgi:hypothetical protein
MNDKSPATPRAGRRCLALVAAALVAAAPALSAGNPGLANLALPGDLPLARFPDSASLRSRLLARKATVHTNEFGSFRLSTVKAGEAFYVLLSARKGGDYPAYSQGSWIIKRSMADGRFLQAKVFLRSDPGCFIRLFPNGDRSLMDVVLYGAVLNKDIPLPVNFDRLLSMPLSTIEAWTEASVDWGLYSPHPGDYRDLLAFSAAIRAHLPGLRYVDDGGLDGQGRPVYIASGKAQPGLPGLNCSGFAQWVVDGLLRPLGEPLLDPRGLAERHPELRKASVDQAIEARYEPFFGLDWTRNLGKAWADAFEPSHRHSAAENDISDSPFALFSASSDAMNGGPPYEDYPAYDPDSGYQMRGLKAMLYVLAMRDPGVAYLASLSRADRSGLRRHYHVAILIPWFDEGGRFRVDVFESAAETSLDAILTRAPRDYVHLVRLVPGLAFEPPIIP